MSFFGFDPKLPDNAETIDFQDSYDGFGEPTRLNGIEDDALNDETFGGDASQIGKDFNFGQQAAPAAKVNPGVSYAQAAQHAQAMRAMRAMQAVPAVHPEEEDGLRPLDSLWETTPNKPDDKQPSKKVLSLEELEANLASKKASAGGFQQPPVYPAPFGYGAPPPPPGFNFNAGMAPPNQQGGYMNYPGGFPHNAPPHLMGGPGYPPMPNGPPPQSQNGQNYGPPGGNQQQFNQPFPQQAPILQNQQQDTLTQPTQPAQSQKTQKEVDLSQFPPLGAQPQHQAAAAAAASAPPPPPPPQQQHQHQHHHHHQPQHYQRHGNEGGFISNYNNYNNSRGDNKQPPANLTPEEEEKFNAKAKKLERIIKYNNIMSPRDRDFVTRFQISQIVTDDPYNEDFYFQIFKAIRSQNTHSDGSLNSIAQYYLEHSGHRLGGKYKRADVALQRMQQQVTKAVTVAKERPKNSQFTKEGSLGKISFGSGKTPRKQLEVFKKEIQANAENVDSKANLLVNFDAKDQSTFKLSNKIVLNCLEKTYANVLKLEALEKNNEELNVNDLWNSLYISNEIINENGERISGQIDELKENIFVSYLNYEKGIKLFPRMLRYFTNEQKLKLIENLFKKISILKSLNESSYEYYYQQDETIRAKIDKKVNLFSNMILKFVISYISNELKFNEIVKLIINMINYNSVIKLLPNKIGLTLITILISKVELIKQDISIMSSDLIIWSNVYDKLFNKLINKLINVFPKQLYIDDNINLVKEYGPDRKTVVKTTVFDDSYIWHFLASLALAGKLQHQRIIVDEVREKVFECVEFAKKLSQQPEFKEESIKRLTNLNLFLNVMGLNASESGDISELK